MSEFRSKSEANLVAATLLARNENRHYDAAIQCCYYSCLQEMLHVIYTKLKISEQELKNKYPAEKGTHKQALRHIIDNWATNQRKDRVWFQAKFPELKQARVNASYHKQVATATEYHGATSLAMALITTLKTNFK